jgi:hypothetical protein
MLKRGLPVIKCPSQTYVLFNSEAAISVSPSTHDLATFTVITRA